MGVLRQRVQDWWQSLARWQQIAAVGIGIGGLALLFYLTILAQTPEYAVAFSGLSEQDAAAVVEALKKSNVPYRIEGNGSVIRVPASQVYEVRLEMARQGLPKGGTVGFEIFDSGQLGTLGMTDFLQRVNYQRALEGELARTIASLEPLQTARVHLVIPEPSLFLEEQKEPSASVLVQLKPGRRLDRGQIEAITHLVASSVEGLKPKNITVVDVEGEVLWSQAEETEGAGIERVSATQIEIQRMYEAEMQNRLQSLLDKTLGPDKAAVQVSVTMDWDRLETSSETYSQGGPASGVLRSSRVIEEYQGRPGALAGGVVGLDANSPQIPSYPGVITATAEGGYVRRETLYNYEVSKTVQNLVKAPGSIKRMSVAVLLDQSVPAEQRRSIEQMVAAAVGLDSSRGDTIALAVTAFDRSFYTAQQKAFQAAQREELLIAGVKALASIIGLALLLLFVRGLFRDLSVRRLHPYMTVLSAGQTAVPIAALEAAQGQLAPSQAVSALAPGPTLAGPPTAQRATEEVTDEVELSALSTAQNEEARYLRHMMMLAREDPDTIVEVIEKWLREG
ncbi:MAG: flagellar basal-body MS-ring/collar protein FliF [Anaerolineae bacterium]|nr:flagellar basal-body MS-ring/collar protein FliF [Anaerolineae bacterium]